APQRTLRDKHAGRGYPARMLRKTSGSTLPPLAMQHTACPKNSFGAASSAATPRAPVGSTFRLASVNNKRTDSLIWSSLTSMIPSRPSRSIAQLCWPTLSVRTPSAMVGGSVSLDNRRPERRERAASLANSGSAPYTWTGQPLARRPRMIPDVNPPPPTGAIIQSNDLPEPASSTPSVALPSITSGSSYGLAIYASPCNAANSRTRAERVIRVTSINSTSPPNSRTASTLIPAELLGITTRHVLLSSWQAKANPWPKF